MNQQSELKVVHEPENDRFAIHTEGETAVLDYQLFGEKIVLATGEHERAFEWLRRAVDQRSPFLNELGVEPRYDPIRSDPRFGDLLRRLDLE